MKTGTEIALAIARELTSDAIWHEERCTWIGPVVERRSGRMVFLEHSLPPDLYGGTAGIGLVLAEVAASTGDDGCAHAARAATRQSLATLERIETQVWPGLFSGWAGVSVAAIRVGLVLQDGELVARGHALASSLEKLPPGHGDDDLVAGRAGTILALLAIGAALDDDRLVEHAGQLGDRVVTALERRATLDPRPGAATPRGLEVTGMAHGTSGACCALLELWAATGDNRFRRCADDAFDTEDLFLDSLSDNWTEGKTTTGPGRAHGDTQAMMSWCRGAPGIGLARQLAWQRTGDDRRRSEALRAARLTERWTRAAMGSFRGGFSLCHGIAGNAEVVRECEGIGEEPAALHGDVCRWGASEFHARGLPWPDCASPSLMTGRAGVAYFYLRAENEGLPLLLLPGPDWLMVGRSKGSSARPRR